MGIGRWWSRLNYRGAARRSDDVEEVYHRMRPGPAQLDKEGTFTATVSQEETSRGRALDSDWRLQLESIHSIIGP